MNEWREYSLGEIYEFASGLSKSADQFGFGFEFLTFKDVFDNFFLPAKLSSLANTTEKERIRCSIKAGDVFLTRTSETQEELGMSSVALKDYPNATFNGFTKRLRPKEPGKVLPEYAGYYFRSPRFRAAVTSMSSITTRASLNNDMLAALKIVVPPIETQKLIAGVLKPIDDKIDLLHRQNATLEAMAETLFRQWFVEEAKEEWEEYQISDIADHIKINVKASANPTTLYYHYSLPAFDEGQVPSKEFGSTILSNKFEVLPRTVLVSKLNPRFPRIWPIGDYLADNSICSTEFQVIRPKQPDMHTFLIFLLKSDSAKEELIMAASGTSGSHQRVRPEDILNIRFAVPSIERAIEYSRCIEPMVKKMMANRTQVQTLSSIRDTLLPKLMSGRIGLDMVKKQNT